MGATPLTLRCPKCKKGRQWRIERHDYDSHSSKDLEPTGKTKIISRTSAGVHNVQAVQMKHVLCGYVFWSTHPTAVRAAFPDAKLEHHGNATSRHARVVLKASRARVIRLHRARDTWRSNVKQRRDRRRG